MKLARVVGTVVSTVKDENLKGKKILLIRALDASGQVSGEPFVALDSVGAGVGEDVFYARGKEGAFPWHPQPVPSDASIVGILDQMNFKNRKESGRGSPDSHAEAQRRRDAEEGEERGTASGSRLEYLL